MRRAVLAIVLATGAAGCGVGADKVVDSQRTGTESADAAAALAPQPRISLPDVASSRVVDAATKSIETCWVEWRTVSTAIEAHWARYGEDVDTIAQLVPEMLRSVPEDWELTVDASGTPTPVATESGGCVGFDPDVARDEVVGPPQGDPSTACDVEYRVVTSAIDAFRYDTGTDPASLDALIPDYLHATPRGWQVRFGDVDDPVAVAAIPGGPCG